jgi:hypothetical protein
MFKLEKAKYIPAGGNTFRCKFTPSWATRGRCISASRQVWHPDCRITVKLLFMKITTQILIFTSALGISACGARDDKNETENYPTYDTTRQANTINDSSNAQQHGEGNLRHNIDDHKNADH